MSCFVMFAKPVHRLSGRRWLLALLCLAVTVSPPPLAEGDATSDAYLLLRSDDAPDKVPPERVNTLILLDLKHQFASESDGLVRLQSLSEYHYRLQSDSNRLLIEVEHGAGQGYARLTSPESGQNQRFRLYPLRRLDADFYRAQAPHSREVDFYNDPGGDASQVVLCDRGFLDQEKLWMVYYNAAGQVTQRLSLSQQEDVLEWMPHTSVDEDSEPWFGLYYALRDNPQIRFNVSLQTASLAALPTETPHDGLLSQTYTCERQTDGRYRLPEPFRNWIEGWLRERSTLTGIVDR